MINEIQKRLFALADEEYRNFHSALIPDVPKDTVIGIRVPLLRSLAKELIREGRADCFTENLPHRYYEENNLHAFIISEIKDFDILTDELKKFLPYIDNWATCDSLRPKAFIKNREKLLPYCYEWIESDNEFTVRFGIEMLMVHFADDMFSSDIAVRVSEITSDRYYVKMMIAWYFATLLSKQWDDCIYILEDKKLEKWIHNKTVQKANESYRLNAEQKTYLKSLRIKG